MFKISILKHFKILQILKTLLKTQFLNETMHFLDRKMQFLATSTENGEKSDRVNHIPNVL